ncbi:MAG: cupin domain-containing protein [Hyphomicrobiaceae bacterium]
MALMNRRGMLSSAIAVSAAATLAPLDGASAETAAHGLLINPADETIRLGPLAVRFLVTGDNSSGSVAAFEVMVPAKQRLAAPPHSHDHYEETIYGVSGVLTWTVDGSKFDVGPGQTLCIPRGAVHRFDNNGDTDVRALCVLTPAAIGPAFFRESSEVINAAAGGPPDVAKMIAIMKRHGITPARP